MDPHSNLSNPNRRKFLRQVGMTAAATAALAGITDIAGMRPALASSKKAASAKATLVRAVKVNELTDAERKQLRPIPSGVTVPNNNSMFCTCSPNHCGTACHPSSVWCHYCRKIASSSTCASGYYCVGGGCASVEAQC